MPDHERADAHIRVGVDIVEVRRIERLLAEVPEIVETIFTGRELAYCSGRRKRAEHLAVRFAGKEAVLKAQGRVLADGLVTPETLIGLGARLEAAAYAAEMAEMRV